MNQYTLKFGDRRIEIIYQDSIQDSYLHYNKVQWAIIILLQFFIFISSAYEQNWIYFSISAVFLLIILTGIGLKGNKQYINNFIIITVVLLNYYKPFGNLFQLFDNNTYYVDGYMACIATISYQYLYLYRIINELSFVKKTFIITSIYILLQVLVPNTEKSKWYQIIQYTIYLGLYLISIYKLEQISRQHFLDNLKNKKVQSQLIQQSGIQLYIVSYQREKNQLLLVTHNTSEKITEEIQQEFIGFMRNMKVLIKDQDSLTQQQSQDAINLDQKMSLEKFLFYFMTSPEKLKEMIKQYCSQHQYDSQIKLQGILKQENYNIQIAKYYENSSSAIIIISQNKKDVYIEELQLKFKILKQAFETIDDIFQSQVKMSLIYFVGLHRDKFEKISQQRLCLYKKIQSKISKAYNDFQNMKDFFNLNTNFQRSIIQSFDLIQFLENSLNEVQKYYSCSKKFSYNISHKLKSRIVLQEQRQLKQLFLNILYFVAEFCQDLTIRLDDGNLFLNKQPFICIKLEYKGSCISRDAIKGLPFINPSTISELRHNSQQAYSLNLPMAIVLIRKLGPINKIFIRQNKIMNYFEFFIFRELSEDFHLMPLQSQHPMNYLITNARSSIHRKQSAYFDLMSLSPRLQLDCNEFNI